MKKNVTLKLVTSFNVRTQKSLSQQMHMKRILQNLHQNQGIHLRTLRHMIGIQRML